MSRANARICLEAARRIDEGSEIFTCNGLKHAKAYRLCADYQEVFELGNGDTRSNSNVNDLWHDMYENATQRRVLMLCLMAAMEFEGKV